MADSAELQNELNFMAWKQEHARRRQQLRTQFNMWREHQHDRMYNHRQYKTEANEQTEQLKVLLQSRLDKACSCNTCHSSSRRSSLGDTGGQPLKAGDASNVPNAA